MKKSELKRKCCVCGRVTYNADTFGTYLKNGKWVEYKCMTRVSK